MSEISTYTREQVLDADLIMEVMKEPNPITQAELVRQFRDRAKSLSAVSDFDELVKAIKKSLKHQLARDGMTDFGMPLDAAGDVMQPLRCGSWIASDAEGIFRFGPIGQRMDACSHPILPMGTYRNAQDGKVKIEIAFKRGGAWRTIIVDKSVTASASKIVSLSDFGIMVTSENARNLVAYLETVESLNPDHIRMKVSTSKLGWTKVGFMPYCTNEITFDSEASVSGVYNAIKAEGSYEAWTDRIKKLRKKRKIELQLYMAAAFASPYIEKMNILPFIVNLYGMTGNGKTVAAMVATSIWANPEVGKYITKAGGTITSLEVYLDLLNNLPAVIDDFAQIKRQVGYAKQDFSQYVYMLCSGQSKSRSNTSLGLTRQRTWNNCIITNSEQSLVTESSQGGVINRIIECESDEAIFGKGEGHSTVEFIKKNYGFAGKDFIELVDEKELSSLWQQFYDRLCEEAAKRGEVKEEKQIGPMALLMAVDQLATDLLFWDKVYMDFETCYNMLKSADQVSDFDRAYSDLRDFTIRRFNGFDFKEWNNDILGRRFNNGDVAFISSVFNGFCSEEGINALSFKRWLKKKDLLDANTDRFDKVVKFNDRTLKCIVVRFPEEEFSEVPKGEKLPFE